MVIEKQEPPLHDERYKFYMNIHQLISNKFHNKNLSAHRMLSDQPEDGILASGYIQKTTKTGSTIDMITNSYHGVLILSGTAIYSDTNHEIQLKEGDYIQRFPGNCHTTITTSDDYSELYIILGKSLFDDLVKINVLNNTTPVLHPGIDFETLNSILHFQDQLGFVDRLELPLLVSPLIGILARITYLSNHNKRTTKEMDVITMATTYIDHNIHKRITGEDVAKELNIGYEKFRKLFTSHYHISLGNYIIHRRINRSQQLLSEGRSITEVALELGYTDHYTFSKQFKKITGRTPSDFRRIFYD